VIDEKAPADLRARVDLDSGQHPADMRSEAAEPAQPVPPEPAREQGCREHASLGSK
jgi:hypothetical protein